MEKLLNGVRIEWRALGDITTLRRGRVMSKGYLIDNIGAYPVYSSQTANNGMIGKIDTFDFDGEFISWTTDGANAGTVFHRTGKFSITNVCGLITINNEASLIYRFLFYWLSIEAQKHVYSGMGNPKLMSHQVEKIPIPIPCPDNPEKSLKIQAEIVRILDAFTELTAELTTELTARKKQYNYYRDQLLSFDLPAGRQEDGEVEWKALGEVGVLVRGNGLQKKDFTETGIPAIHYGQIYTFYGLSTIETKSFVSPGLAKQLKKVDKGNVVITNTSENIEDVGKALVYLGERQAVTGGHATIFKPGGCILGKYFAYFTQTDAFASEKKKYAKGTKVIDVSATDMAKIVIPIPCPENPEKSLAEQARIVAILDKFDALTNSISEGLPREIELRQKQYEYYRDLLFSFPKPEVEA
jgi:type I restriction enzyme S subunit